MNKNYNNGRAREYQTMRTLEALGYECFRTAGSHSPIDVIAFLKENITNTDGLPVLRAIQCKSKKYLQKNEIKNLTSYQLPLTIRKEIWHYRPRQEVKIIIC